ncbi:unnamed protein product [Strongylus vulgaris]|uniref:threonine--tRNA ligase n=1 Tax=Strongylus vulgaris TaxID=40348 RepID=A0A3P7L773_STRVU|nr:unnamed protein product [Strongylus vulgaris]
MVFVETYSPDFIVHKCAERDPTPIKITLPDGKQFDGEAWRTTPLQIAEKISKGLADTTVIAKVNGEVWDLDRPFEKDSTLFLLKFDDDEAKQLAAYSVLKVFWHSSAHILGEAMERYCGGHLCYGPPIQEGFYYDMWHDVGFFRLLFDPQIHLEPFQNCTISQEDFPKLDQIVKCAVKDKQPFERLEMSKEDLLEMFKYNEFKVRIINEKIDTPKTTVYRCGPLIDLCRGPHVRHTGKIKALQITKSSSSYWEGKADAESLQRIYGISFPDPKQLKEWQKVQEEAAKRDHRKLGRDQELFFFNPLSPGSAFWYPKGAHIYNTLMNFMRKEYRKRGFTEVITPNMFNSKLWETSGHWQHYAEDMFRFEVEKEQFGLKPMNCPGHCLMYSHQPHTYNELPMRYADFGVLHRCKLMILVVLITRSKDISRPSIIKALDTSFVISLDDCENLVASFTVLEDIYACRNEMSGALTGLTRVRRFQQDDAHIFCRKDQISDEIRGCLDFLSYCYETVFGFTFKLNLATRPEGFLGEISTWNEAEADLKAVLNESGREWGLNEGDGAFYGPKALIDITIQDALRRYHQCATIQLDFQLPQRFDLTYFDDKGEKQRPVMIHRAILGSVERMTAILTENYGGKWPFWLSPRQVEFDEGCPDTLNKQIRNAQLAQFNFILVVGAKEKENGTVNVRTRDNAASFSSDLFGFAGIIIVRGEVHLDALIAKFRRFAAEYTKDTESADEFAA